MTLDDLLIKIRVAADGTEGELDGVLRELRGFVERATDTTEKGAQSQAMAWAALSAAAGAAFGKICSAIQTGIDASNAYTAAVKGLSSVASANNIGTDEMQAALDGMTDSFFDAGSAATAFKNLLSRGYTLEQATRTIDRLKNAAAYGRQSSLSLAQAVVSATEGIKNENSALVNAA